MKGINVTTPKYEGPLELLYELVEKNKIDIYDIPISLLADQYLEAISLFSDRDMDSMSAFVLMGAHLLEIKSRMLLPKQTSVSDEEEVDPRIELALRLAEYKKYKQAAEMFAELGLDGGMEYYKGAEDGVTDLGAPDIDSVIRESLDGISIGLLYKAFLDTLARRELSVDKVRGGFGAIKKDTYTIADKMIWLRELLKTEREIRFSELFDRAANKPEIIVTFLALLELMKQRIIQVVQESGFGEIIIKDHREDEVNERRKNENIENA